MNLWEALKAAIANPGTNYKSKETNEYVGYSKDYDLINGIGVELVITKDMVEDEWELYTPGNMEE